MASGAVHSPAANTALRSAKSESVNEERTGPDCTVMCNLINTHTLSLSRTHTHTHTHFVAFDQRFS